MEPRADHPGMELRTYLVILRRRRALIALVTLLVGGVAFLTSNFQTPVYSAEAKVLLLHGNAAEQIDQTSQVPLSGTEADRYLTAQLDVIQSEAIAAEATRLVPRSTGKGLLRQVSARQAGTTDIILISADDPDPKRASLIANAFARTYIENRRLNAVKGLDKAVDEIGVKLGELTKRIADLDAQIQAAKVAAQKAAAKAIRPGTTPAVDATEPAIASDDQLLTAARQAATLQYQSLFAQQQTLLVNKSLKKGEAELIEEAKLPSAPSSPRPKRSTAFGLGVGLLLGLALAFLREQLDDRIRSREEAEEISKLPVLAELPYDDASAEDASRVTSHDHSAGPLAESARSLRTSLTFLGVDKPLRRMVVTSAGPGEGKSFVTANLAAVYAQAGLRTVIVSADLRRPRIDTIFPEAASQGPGLTGAITAFARAGKSVHHALLDQFAANNGGTLNGDAVSGPQRTLAEAVRPTRVENLFLLPAGKLPPNPAEMLGSLWCNEVLDCLQDMVDIVIIDAPPTLVVTDASLLATNADGVILVAAAGETHRGGLARAVGTLAKSHATLLGIVLNKVDKASTATYYGYGTYGGPLEPANTSRLPWRRRKDDGDDRHSSDAESEVGAGVS